MKITVSAELCLALISYALKVGINTESIIKRLGLSSIMHCNTYERVPFENFGMLWTQIMQETNDVNFGLNYGLSGYSIQGGGILASILKNCSTIGDALEKLVRYHDLNGEMSLFELEKNEKYSSLIVKPIQPRFEFHRHHAEAMIGSIFKTLQELSGNKNSPLEIHFAHAKPHNITYHATVLKTKLYFKQKDNRLVFDQHYLLQPIYLANNKLLEALQQFAKKQLENIQSSSQWSKKVKRSIGEILLQGDKPGVEIISQNLNLSIRNLQSRSISRLYWQ